MFQVWYKNLKTCYSLLQEIKFQNGSSVPFAMVLVTEVRLMSAIMLSLNILRVLSFTSVIFVIRFWQQNKL